MSTESIIIIVTLFVLMIPILCCLVFIGRQIDQELKKRRKLQEVALYTEMFRNVGSVYELLDSYINERFSEYKVFNAEQFTKPMNNNQQTELAKKLTVDVIDTMSPAFYTQLTLILNPDSKKIHTAINNRVTMAVIADSLGFNEENDDEA